MKDDLLSDSDGLFSSSVDLIPHHELESFSSLQSTIKALVSTRRISLTLIMLAKDVAYLYRSELVDEVMHVDRDQPNVFRQPFGI